ncbi:MAG: efflux RND transporter periplasmic adaptor subunit [Bacteroidales bacterium]|nr:efflux RND transporter periplasmic adaptor subunit [Bacteroidales bacterium]
MEIKKSFVLLASAAVILFTSCGKKEDTTTQKEVKKEKVETSHLQKQKIERVLSLSTTLQGYETVNIAPSVTGNIEHIYVDVSSRVSQGQMLVRMDRTQYNSAKLTFANLGVELSRTEALKKSGSVSQQVYDQTKLQYDQTKTNLEFLEQNTFVKAPFSGVISAKNYEDGELYGGQPILTLTKISTLKAYIAVPESYFPLVKAGQKITLTSEIYPDQVFDATIETIYPTVDASTHTFQVKLKIPNGKEVLRPGMYVKTELALGEVEAVMAPYQAVLKLVGANDRYIFVNNNGVAKRLDVELGQRVNSFIEISGEGVEEGLEIVTVGQGRLVDGSQLEVTNK